MLSWRSRQASFEQIAEVMLLPMNVTGLGEAEQADGLGVVGDARHPVDVSRDVSIATRQRDCDRRRIGTGLSWFSSAALDGMLYGTTATDPRAFVVAAATLMVVACLATLVPAVRASRVDPLTALRNE